MSPSQVRSAIDAKTDPRYMGGYLLWGEGVQGTYGKRVELTLARSF